MKKAFSIAFIVCSLAGDGFTQHRKSGGGESFRLSTEAQSVHLTLERVSERPPLKTGESEQGVWLRLHNDSGWAISYSAFDVPEEYGEVGMYHEVVSVQNSQRGPAGERTLNIGYGPPHVFSTVQLSPGKSVVFSVPREHLAKGLAIRISFNYEWEDQDDVFAGHAPRHYVYFHSSKLKPNVR